jgi:carboxymethylenebutenolidase
MTMIDIDGGYLKAYRADPAGQPRGAVIVIHEIWGLVDHITDIADRFAEQGYLAIAPDLMTGIGVPPEVGLELHRLMFFADEKERSERQPYLRERLDPIRAPEYAEWAVGALQKVVDYLEHQPGVDGRIAVTGFCFGGGYSFALAATDPRVRAALPFYGSAPAAVELAHISCPVLAFYGDTDERLMTLLPGLTETLRDAGIDFTAKVYPDTGHAFFNDTNATMYRPAAAADAWKRSLEFLEKNL